MAEGQESATRGIEYVKSHQSSDGGWGSYSERDKSNPVDTALGILALNAMGEGPKIAKSQMEWENLLSKQQARHLRPYFVHTSPLFGKSLHIKQIHDKMVEMIKSAQKTVRVSTLYFDMLYENIIERAERENVEFKIVVRPRADIKGVREKINKNVLDIMNRSTKGNVRTNPISHSRLLIIDDKEVLVSTADLTRDQLFDEYNAGMWTRDTEVVVQAIDFFENLWNESDKLT